jgi:hypothetical protein
VRQQKQKKQQNIKQHLHGREQQRWPVYGDCALDTEVRKQRQSMRMTSAAAAAAAAATADTATAFATTATRDAKTTRTTVTATADRVVVCVLCVRHVFERHSEVAMQSG